MTIPNIRRFLSGQHGFTLLEVLVVAAIFAIVSLGAGSLYLLGTRGVDDGSAQAYVQRQGTQIAEEMARHSQRATALTVDNSQVLCKPSAGESAAAGKGIIYQRTVGSSSTAPPDTDEFWCLYEFQGAQDTFPLLWRCQVAGITPPQTCTSTPENLFASALRGFRGLGIGDTGGAGTSFTQLNCAGCACPGCPASADVRFPLDVKRSTSSNDSVLGGARWFGFNITIRN